MNGPCYDVAFFQEDIIFMKSGEEGLFTVPMLRPDTSFSQPLFSNHDISCSPAAISFSGDFSKGYYTRPVMGSQQALLKRYLKYP
jgi:hypothetical protein